jgi:hypothetical protein
MKKHFIVIFLAIFILIPFQSVSAHVLITDDTNTKGAILHIFPDDDPVAGEVATLYFDAQEQLISNDESVVLTIKSEAGYEFNVPTEFSESLVTADFIFPDLGVYQITYLVKSGSETYTFNQSQRISRGTSNSDVDTQKYSWAEMMLVGSGILLALLFIVGFNNRKDIIKYSKIG